MKLQALGVSALAIPLVIGISSCDSDGALMAITPDEGVVLSDPVGVLDTTDGDTLEVIRDGEEFLVRLKGIDTPELWPKPDSPEDWEPDPYAEEAWDFVASSVGAQVGLEYDADCVGPVYCKDPYGRVLAYIRIEDGRDLALELLKEGLADVMIFQGEPFDRLVPYVAARDAAQDAGVGIWSL